MYYVSEIGLYNDIKILTRDHSHCQMRAMFYIQVLLSDNKDKTRSKMLNLTFSNVYIHVYV